MPLLLHGEVTDRHIDIFDREAAFIDRVLTRIIADFPALKIVLEHITTEDAVRFVEAAGANLGATITPHHLVINRNAIFEGGIRPHLYCLPIAKREKHRLALRKAATSGSSKFFLGTDSAPHAVGDKESACGLCRHLQCAGRARDLCDGVRRGRGARPARGLRVRERAPASTACRSTRARSRWSASHGVWARALRRRIQRLSRFRPAWSWAGPCSGRAIRRRSSSVTETSHP